MDYVNIDSDRGRKNLLFSRPVNDTPTIITRLAGSIIDAKSLPLTSVLFGLNERYGRSQKMSLKNAETEADRRSQDTFFLTRLADFPMDKQIQIDRCRELLNELALLGIAPDGLENARNELKQSVATFDSLEHRMAQVSEEYRNLKRLDQNLALAANTRFIHGPLFDEKEEKSVERTLVENVDQLRPEDRAEEEKHRYDFRNR